MSDLAEPCCGNCPFYVKTNDEKGECHADPPKLFPMITGQGLGLFPPVAAAGFCGRHPVLRRRHDGDILLKKRGIA